MNLYHVYHSRPRAIRPGITDHGFDTERVEVGRLPREDLRDALISIGGDVEVVPIGDSPNVCGVCQFQVAVRDGYCQSCWEYAHHVADEVA